MANLATTYLQQARGFLRAGDPQRAIELLEKALVLASDDPQLQEQVLQEMAGACSSAGRHEQAARCRQRLDALAPASMDMSQPGAGTITLPPARKRNWMAIVGIIIAILVLIAGAIVVTVVVMQSRNKSATMPAAMLPPTQPQAQQEPPAMAPVIASSPISAPAVAAPATAVARNERLELLKDTVGLVIVMLRYEGTAAGKDVRFDIPWSAGAGFAITQSGIMLTNKHVTESINSPDIPPTLQDMGMPTLVLRGRSVLVCFGPAASDRYVGKLIHQSAKYDLAVLKVARKFTTTLAIASAPPKQGDTVYACGFPSMAQEVLDQSAGVPARMAQLQQAWHQDGRIQSIDTLSPASFDAALVKGIVSAPERNIDGAAYLQADSAIIQGNSGSPAINERNEVVGIITIGVKQGSAGVLAKYGFALLVEQFRDEIDSYLKDH